MAQPARIDVVVLINGDSATAEVKSLEFGELRYSTDSMAMVSIDWEEVVSLKSDQDPQLEVAPGTRHFGNRVRTGSEGKLAVGRGGNARELKMPHVVRIMPIETDDRFLQRL